MYYIYILFSKKLNRYYVGYTANIESRIAHHNQGRVIFTSKGIPWEYKYSEKFDIEIEARRREKEIKNKKSRKYIEWLILSEQSRKLSG
ncbi:MAG: GIY-YIG nuclease family protein [Bacteroidota bacterium]